MRSLKLVGLAVILALGAGVTGYALAARPTPSPAPVVESTECAVPVAVAPLAVVEPAEPAHEEPAREEPAVREDRSAGGAHGGPLGGEVRSRRLILTHAIEDHEPVDDLDVVEGLARGERLYAFVDLSNAGEATEVEVTFRHESGLSVGRVTLEVPAHASRYRTWAYSSHVEEPGNWTALVRAADGRTIASYAFEVR